MAYASGEFQISFGSGGAAASGLINPVAAYFAQQIWVISARRAGRFIWVPSGFDISVLPIKKDPNNPDRPIDIEGGEAAKPANWTTTAFEIPGSDPPVTTGDCGGALTANANDGFFIWMGTSDARSFHCSRYTTGDDGQPAWQAPVTLVSHDPANITLEIAGDVWTRGPPVPVAATSFGEDVIYVAFCSTGQGPSYVGAFHVADIDTANARWPARSGLSGPQANRNVGLDWFGGSGHPLPAPPPPPPPPALPVPTTPRAAPTITLMFSVDSLPSGGTGGVWLVPLDGNGDIVAGEGAWTDQQQFPAPRRDPGGRLCSYAPVADQVIREITSTGQSLLDDAGNWRPPVRREVASCSGVPNQPVAIFFNDSYNGVAVTLDGTPASPAGTAYPSYEFLFYTINSTLCGQVSRYGTTETYPNFATLTPTPRNSDNLIPMGIIDAPVPIPNATLAYATIPSSGEFATLGYGLTDQGETDHVVSNSFTVGFKSDGRAETGFGPAWDISVKGGMGWTNSDGTTTTIMSTLRQTTKLDEATRDKMGAQAVEAVGHVFGSKIAITWISFRFRDASGTLVVDGTDAKFKSEAAMTVTMSTSATPHLTAYFPTYSVSPGDLDSYTVEGINARMGDGYFQKIIEPNAYPFTETAHYLSISWDDEGGQSEQSFDRITEHVAETSWNVDAEFYVGVSGGDGATIFGLGEKEDFEFMLGGSYSHLSTAATKTGRGWSLGLEGTGLSLPPTDPVAHPEAAKRYSFRIYYLPPPAPDSGLPANHWTKELADHLAKQGGLDGATIDESAGAWRILYVVDSYELHNGKKYPNVP